MQAFLKYWSLAFVIFAIFLMALYVAWMDLKRELLEAARKKAAQRKGVSPATVSNPLLGKSVSQTLLPVQQPTEKRQWVMNQVLQVAAKLGVNARIFVLQDSKEHYLVHFADSQHLLTYRVDRDWVAEALKGDQEKMEKIQQVVEGYLRKQWLGEKPAPTPAATPSPEPKASPGAEAAKGS